MLDVIKNLLKSRKAVSTLLAVTAATVLCALGKVPPDDFLHFTGALTAVLVASIGLEDAAEKRNEGPYNRGDLQ